MARWLAQETSRAGAAAAAMSTIGRPGPPVGAVLGRTLDDVADTLAIIGTQVVTVLGVLYYLGQRIDRQGRELREEMRATRSELREELRAMGADIRGELRTARAELTPRLDAHVERHAT